MLGFGIGFIAGVGLSWAGAFLCGYRAGRRGP